MNKRETFEKQYDYLTLEGIRETNENLISKIELQDEYIRFLEITNERIVEKLKNKELKKNE